jgi:hypothetical protein
MFCLYWLFRTWSQDTYDAKYSATSGENSRNACNLHAPRLQFQRWTGACCTMAASCPGMESHEYESSRRFQSYEKHRCCASQILRDEINTVPNINIQTILLDIIINTRNLFFSVGGKNYQGNLDVPGVASLTGAQEPLYELISASLLFHLISYGLTAEPSACCCL